MYYRFQADLYADHGIVEDPELPDDVTFMSGSPIAVPLPAPLVFAVDYPKRAKPDHLLGDSIPVASDLFVAALQAAGVDNVQTFPATLHNPENGGRWTGYQAINVIGLVDAVHPKKSKYDVIMPGDGDEVPPLLDFRELVFARGKVGELPVFRLLQNPTQLFMSERVREQLIARSPAGGWVITTIEVPVR